MTRTWSIEFRGAACVLISSYLEHEERIPDFRNLVCVTSVQREP